MVKTKVDKTKLISALKVASIALAGAFGEKFAGIASFVWSVFGQ